MVAIFDTWLFGHPKKVPWSFISSPETGKKNSPFHECRGDLGESTRKPLANHKLSPEKQESVRKKWKLSHLDSLCCKKEGRLLRFCYYNLYQYSWILVFFSGFCFFTSPTLKGWQILTSPCFALFSIMQQLIIIKT